MQPDLVGHAVLCEGQVGVAREQDVIVIVAREVLTLAHCRFIDSFVSDVRASGVPAVGVLYVLKHDQVQRSNDVRRAMIDVIVRHRASMKGFGLVHTGTGFVAAAQRGVLTMMTTASAQRDIMGIFSDLDAGARWLLPRMSRGVSPRSVHMLAAHVDDALQRQHSRE